MIIFGSAEIPKIMRWKDGEWLVAINQRDMGVQSEEREGMRYEADFTIVKEGTIDEAIDAFTRMTLDPVHDQLVIDNIEIEGTLAIDIKKEYPTKVSSTIFPPLPPSGALKKGQVFSYNNGSVMVVQDHDRTIYAPELTPALFSFWRDNTSTKMEWIEGEKVEKGWKRTFGGKTYECLQSHQTQKDWTPELTLGTLWQVVATTSEWTVGVAYKVGDIVTYQGKTYRCLQGHVSQTSWSPSVVPALWQLQ